MNITLLLSYIIVGLITYLVLVHVSDKFYSKSLKFWSKVYLKLKEKKNNESKDKEDKFWDTLYSKIKERALKDSDLNED